GQLVGSSFFQRASNSAKSFLCLSMLARDQSRVPPGCSSRLTSSPVNGAHFARHAQKSFANLSKESVAAEASPNNTAPRNNTAQLFFMDELIRASTQRDEPRIFVGPIHRRAVTKRSGFFARITNLVQFFVPMFHVGAVRSFFAGRDGHITILGKCEKSCFAR